ncbi:JmjC domain-containing histone demethylation protein 1 [Stygiomarasmius scandens]|uniref:JmjC domain-containing histone demethylation protein 1 n=1 Tax=Marasmiellus scandens TaxID=2682957 RepID=A0ABR1JSX8_9AGAR
MAGRRKSTRNNDKPPEGESNNTTEDRCPACTNETTANLQFEDKEEWAMCGACKTWYHWRCAGNGEELDTVDKWYCKTCLAADSRRTITFKAPTRKSERKKTTRDYANLNSGFEPSDPRRFIRVADSKPCKPDNFRRMSGSEVRLEWLEEDPKAMTEPIVIESPDGLEMTMPAGGFTVNDVGLLVGEQTPVEVIDVASQSSSSGWTLAKWVEYCNLEPSERDKILNVISLEVSSTPLADRVVPPRLVRELDWVENFWPSTKKGKGNAYPKVQLYCLMGVEGAWTDWHVDFAGSSVYYHIVSGSKVFYFIKPTPANLAAYERWSGTEVQNHTWLGDMVDEVMKVTLVQGNTMIIPTGWIHAVYTPVDTLVFGGNFLHSYNVTTQLRVRDIEIKTHVPKKFRFPFFSKLCWYVADKYLKDLKTPNGVSLPPRVLTSISSLVDFLMSEVHTLEQGAEHAKKEVREQIPHDRIKDAPALVRELRWRVKHASGYTSDDEDEPGRQLSSLKRKRKRSESVSGDVPRFRNFKPKGWDKVVESCGEPEQLTLRLRRPDNDEEWTEKWIEDAQTNGGEEVGEEASMQRTNITIVKVRKTADGLEKERIERRVERWTWK